MRENRVDLLQVLLRGDDELELKRQARVDEPLDDRNVQTVLLVDSPNALVAYV